MISIVKIPVSKIVDSYIVTDPHHWEYQVWVNGALTYTCETIEQAREKAHRFDNNR